MPSTKRRETNTHRPLKSVGSSITDSISASNTKGAGMRCKLAALTAVAVSAAVLGLAPTASASGPYANCTQAHANGRYDIPQGDPDYWPAGDRDHDGIACES
jgi:hypothetical protein